MTADSSRIEAVFFEALAIGEPSRRAALLDRACSGDAVFRRRVELLLAAHESPSNALVLPDVGSTPLLPLSEGPGATIGGCFGGSSGLSFWSHSARILDSCPAALLQKLECAKSQPKSTMPTMTLRPVSEIP